MKWNLYKLSKQRYILTRISVKEKTIESKNCLKMELLALKSCELSVTEDIFMKIKYSLNRNVIEVTMHCLNNCMPSRVTFNIQ